MSLRDKLDVVPTRLVGSLSALLDVHKLSATPRDACYALGMGDLAFQDREFVDIRGGSGSFGQLRNIKDADSEFEVVNYRTLLNALYANDLGTNNIVLPFGESQKQFLTANGQQLTATVTGSGSGNVLLWSALKGPHFGLVSTDILLYNAEYVIGDTRIVIGSAASYPGIPVPYQVFPSLDAFSAYAQSHVFFGTVSVYLKDSYNGGVLDVPYVARPFQVRLIPAATSVAEPDAFIVRNTRLHIDCGTESGVLPLRCPALEFADCVLDDRSFLALVDMDNSIPSVTFRRCRGQLHIYGYPSSDHDYERLQVIDSDLVLSMSSPLGSMFKTQRYRYLMARNSEVVAATGNSLDFHLVVDASYSRLAARTGSVNLVADYWTQDSEASFLYNKLGAPLYVHAVGSDVLIPHMTASKTAWITNGRVPAQLLSSPIASAKGSTVHVLNIGDAGDQGGVYGYRPPSMTNPVLVEGALGSKVLIGIDRPIFSPLFSAGFFINRTAIASVYGSVLLTPVLSDGTSYGSVTDMHDDPYTTTELGVIHLPASVVRSDIETAGVPL